MTVTFSLIDHPYSDEIFELIKQGLYEYVEQVFGWDDEFQRQRIRDDYQDDWFHWTYLENQQIGLVCFKRYEQAMHLHLIILAPEFQGHGYGKKVMAAIHKLADSEARKITLTSFKCNHRAVSLYQSLGYRVSDTEEHFLAFVRNPQTNA